MKFQLDEHLPVEFVVDLRQAGHDAMTVVEQHLSGASDQDLMRIVQAEARVMLTMDKGIANVVSYPPQAYAGIVLFRPGQTGRGYVLSFVRQHFSAALPHIAPGVLVVVSESGIRIR